MSKTHVIHKPVDATGEATRLGDMYQVVLFNDDHTFAGYVVQCLMRVFGHNRQMATRIMLEAHRHGRSIAEVEAHEKAQLHKDQLQSDGLTAAVEKI